MEWAKSLCLVDDGIYVAPSFVECIFAHDLIIGDLQHAGLRNLLKSQLDQGYGLGLLLILIEGSVAVPCSLSSAMLFVVFHNWVAVPLELLLVSLARSLLWAMQ